MGVPGFFLWLIKNYKKTNFLSNLKPNIDYLMFDANCLIHPICAQVTKNININDNKNIDTIEQLMLNNIIEYIEKIIDFIDPLKGIFIAIDGVAPLAKIKQQRTRRYKSIADTKLINNIKRKHNKEISYFWNTNAITPGTKFMDKLHNYILEWIKNNKYKINIIYSSYLNPGEGEHKLLNYIRDNKIYSYIIYGLDADLIFLSLSVNIDNIYLLRESNHFDNTIKNETIDSTTFTIVNIDTMKELIIETFNKYIKYETDINIIDNLDKNKLISDFIFICYFLGNDFLPHIPSIEIYDNGIDELFKAYATSSVELFLDNKSNYIIENNNINIHFLKKFITILSLNEENYLKKKFNNKGHIKCNSNDSYDREMFKIENLLFKFNDPIKLGMDNHIEWRKRYYKHYWNVSDDELEPFSEKMVYDYLIGLKWIALYYFDSCHSWDWYYPYDYSPFLSDISKYIKNINNYEFTIGKPLKPFMQLLIVLPPTSNSLLPTNFRKLVTNPKSSLIHLYPTEIEQDYINKRKHWMAIPILPPLNVKAVKKSYYKYLDELDENELKRNILIYTNF